MASPYRTAPFVPDRFRSTVPYYVAHRLPYPAALIDAVVARAGLGPRDRVLDLGCGPGTLTIDLARRGAGEVVGLDPDPAMIEAAGIEARKAGVDARFFEGSSRDLSPALGTFKLVTMARSFHWMDRAATLRALDGMVAPDGAVAILSETPEPAPENQWKQILKEVQRGFRGDLCGGSRHHAAVLLASPFSDIEDIGVFRRGALTFEAILGRALSELESSPQALADDRPVFEAELRARLAPLAPDGRFSELIRFGALVARRPAGASRAAPG